MSSNDLIFERFLSEEIERRYGTGWSGNVDNNVRERAINAFSLRVADALQRALLRCIHLSNLMKSERGVHFMRFGAGRRLHMIWYAYSDLIFALPPERTAPLTSDQSAQLNENLNSIYIHMRGVLDNVSWALLHEYAPEDVKELKPVCVGLFEPCICKGPTFQSIAKQIEKHRKWYTELKSRRDPVTHQMPLIVCPQVLTSEQSRAYNEALQRYERAVARNDWNAAKGELDVTEQIGKFYPWFFHDPDEEPLPIYPTVPSDVGHLVSLFRAVDSFFVERS